MHKNSPKSPARRDLRDSLSLRILVALFGLVALLAACGSSVDDTAVAAADDSAVAAADDSAVAEADESTAESGDGSTAATSQSAESDADTQSGDGELPTIVVTTSVLGDVVTNLVGDAAEVVTIMPAGADPHVFQASAQQAAALTSAEVIIVNGADFEEGLLDILDAAEDDGAAIFAAIDAVATLEYGEAHDHHDHGDGDHEDHGDEDHDDHDHGDDDHGDEDHDDHDHGDEDKDHGDEDHGDEDHGDHDHGDDDHGDEDHDDHDHGDDDHGDEGHDDHGDEDKDRDHGDEDHDDHDHGDDDHGDEDRDDHDHGDDDHGDEDHDDHDHGDEEKGHDDHDHDDHGHDDHDDHDRDDHEGHDHSGVDPHFFADPARMADAVEAIGEFLIDNVDGIDAAEVRQSAAEYAAELDALDAEIAEMLAVVPDDQRVLVTNHDVFSYFAERYDFEVIGTVISSGSTNDGADARSLAELAELLEAEGVNTVFVDASASDELAQTVASEVDGVSVVELFSESLGPDGSDGSTYIDMISTNVSRIADALGG